MQAVLELLLRQRHTKCSSCLDAFLKEVYKKIELDLKTEIFGEVGFYPLCR